MVKLLAFISLTTALACVSADGLIGVPAALYGPPAIGAVEAIRTLEPVPLGSIAIFPPKVLPPPIVLTETVPHHVPVPHIVPVPAPTVVTHVIREQVAVPAPVHIHHHGVHHTDHHTDHHAIHHAIHHAAHHVVHHTAHHTAHHPVPVVAPVPAPYPAPIVPAPTYGVPSF